MKVLVIGAGAVGQVFGHHLGQAGDEIVFYVRPKYATAMKNQLTLYQTSYRGLVRHHMLPHRTVHSTHAVNAEQWDEIWLAVSSTALSGDWLGELLSASPRSIIVSLQPGMESRAQLLRHIEPARLVSGAIAFLAWQAPLPGEQGESPGIQYWFPPLARSPFSGPREACTSIISRLKQGGCPATKTRDAVVWAALPSAIMMPHIVGLELESWSLTKFGASKTLATSVAASREAMHIASRHYNRRSSLITYIIRPWVMRAVLWLAGRCTPLNLETYLAYHFTKVGDQTRALIAEYIQAGTAMDTAIDSLSSLHEELIGQASGFETDR